MLGLLTTMFIANQTRHKPKTNAWKRKYSLLRRLFQASILFVIGSWAIFVWAMGMGVFFLLIGCLNWLGVFILFMQMIRISKEPIASEDAQSKPEIQ